MQAEEESSWIPLFVQHVQLLHSPNPVGSWAGPVRAVGLERAHTIRRRKQHHKQQKETQSKLATSCNSHSHQLDSLSWRRRWRERERVTVPLNVPNVLIFSSLNKTVAPFNPLQTLLGRPAMPWLLRCIGVAFTAGQTVGPYDLVAVQLLEEAPGAKLRQFGMSCCWWNWRHTS